MAEVCSGVVTETEASPPCESSSRASRRRRMELRKLKFIAGVTPPETENGIIKRPKLELCSTSVSRFCDNAVDNSSTDDEDQVRLVTKGSPPTIILAPILSPLNNSTLLVQSVASPKFGFASVCGRRRDMEDAVAIHPSFCQMKQENSAELHYFAVYDGHGCSHVATKCEERLHELVKEELENNEGNDEWELAMDRSFNRMDKEVIAWNKSMIRATCRCELHTPECDAVGSTAVVAVVTADKIIVANCGDSRAVLCRNGKAIPLSNDQKPDRPDELNRIQEAGGRVIYWDGPRVSGVLAMSRAIGDNYLKPYVICEPEVTITDRTAEDDCLILASDGLWDVVSNDTACGVAGMCLKGKAPVSTAAASMPENVAGGENPDQSCSDASMLLTKLALARRSSAQMATLTRSIRRTFSTAATTTSLSPIRAISDDLYKERNLKRLVEKFKQYSDVNRFRTKNGIYESTVQRLASAKKFKWIEEILEHQKQYKSDISKESFAARLVSLYGKCGLFENAQKVFDEMPDRNCKQTLKSVNALLGASVNSKKYDKLETLFKELPEKLKVKPDVVTYNIMIKGLCDKGALDKAAALIDEIEKNGLNPDLVTFNTILGAFYSTGKFDAGEKVWKLMVSKNVTPDIRSYNAKLVGLINNSKVSEAAKLVGELGSFELKPDVFTYGTLIRGYCDMGNLEEAKKWYLELVKSGSSPNKVIFGSVITAACEKGDFDWAFELCKDVFKKKCHVDAELLQGVVDGMVKSSRIWEAKEVVRLGKSNDYHLYKLKLPSDD